MNLLNENTFELEKIVEAAFYGLMVTDAEGRVILVNRSLERITGLPREVSLGKKMSELVESGLVKDSAVVRVLKSLRTEKVTHNLPSGKQIFGTANPVFDTSGKLWRVVVNCREIAEITTFQHYVDSSASTDFVGSGGFLNDAVVSSEQMKEIEDLAKRLGHVDSTILILGESGTGKEVCADLVHKYSARAKQPFVKVSCSAIADNLLEPDLFGYIGGAFTGANPKGKQVFFEKADKGTLFLDEVGELPLHLQSKLLRVLQERVIIPVGSNTPVSINVRIICATNRNLEEMVEQGLFRKDLYYRLNVVSILVPPLRERKAAINDFVYRFLHMFNLQYGYNKQLSHGILDIFSRYDWPGNIRELKNTIERLVVVSKGDLILPDDLPNELKRVGSAEVCKNITLEDVLKSAEKGFITECLKGTRTTRDLAKRLGISQSSVVRKLKEHNIRLG